MRITKWGEFGVLSCAQIARRMYPAITLLMDGKVPAPVPVGAAEIAAVLAIPLEYTQQILHRLRKGGVIKSVRGPGGGFLLTRPAKDISIMEVLIASEGTTFDQICDEGVHPACSKEGRVCGLRSIWKDLELAINSVLKERSVQDILNTEDTSSDFAVFNDLVNIADARSDRPGLKVTLPANFKLIAK